MNHITKGMNHISISINKRLTEVLLEEELRSSKELETKVTVGKKLILATNLLFCVVLYKQQ